jgi:hypothetical protein
VTGGMKGRSDELLGQSAGGESSIRSAGDFCKRFFPHAHKAKECPCYEKPEQPILVIQPRSGRRIRVV